MIQQKRRYFFLFTNIFLPISVVGLAFNADVEAKTDLKSLQQSSAQVKREYKADVAKPTATKKRSALIADPDGEPRVQDLVKLRESLKGINLVLSNQPQTANRTELLLKKAFLHVTLVRETGRKRTSATQLTPDEHKHLEVARKILNRLLEPSSKLPETKKTSVYYLLGLAAYEYENYPLQQKYFIEALRIDPKSPQAGSLALMVAEQYFDDEKFDKALQYYNGFLNVMSDQQKDLALYKSAWCYISNRQNEKAEAELIKVVQSKRQSGFQKDSLRDLAFIAVRHRDEIGIIRYGQQVIVNESDRYEFYSLALKYFFQMQTRQSLNRLIGVVLKTEKRLDVRLEILGHQINEFRRDYMNPIVLSYYQGIRLELEKNKMNLNAPDLVVFKKNFQIDMEFFLYSISQVYQTLMASEKKKTSADALKTITQPETKPVKIADLNRAKVANLLEKTILFYDYFFPDSNNKILTYMLFADLCLDAKSYACVTQVYNKAKNHNPEDKNWNELRMRLRTSQLVFADELYTADPIKNEALLMQVFNNFKRDYPTHELVVKGLKRTLQIYSQKNDLVAIEKNYAEIYQKEKNAENLYNWSLTLFKQSKFSEVLSLIEGQFLEDTRLNQLRVEVHLRMADKESQGDNFKNYESHIVEILKINKDPEKIALIYSDWIQKSLSLKVGGVEHALEVYNSMPSNIRSRPIFDPFPLRLAGSFLLLGDFEKLGKLDLARKSSKQEDSLTYYRLIQFFASASTSSAVPNWVNLMDGLDEDRRNYLLGLLVLLKPQRSIDYFANSKSYQNANRADLYLLSLKMLHQSEDFSLSKQDKRILGAKAELIQAKVTKPLKVLSEIRAVKFPSAKLSFQKYNLAVEKLVPSVKKVREKIQTSFANASIEQKLEVIPEAEQLESKTAKSIQEAPLPPELDEVQKAEYQAGINELAKEFAEQAAEYKKMFDGLSAKVNELNAQKNADILPSIDLKKWIWPSGAVTQKALGLQEGGGGLQAHLYIDAQLAEKAISEVDHATIRVGLLGMSQNSAVMREYIKQELLQQQREVLVQKWKSLNSSSL